MQALLQPQTARLEIEVVEKSDTIVFTLVVDPPDRGRVLGKQGKTIASLRAIFQSIATLHDRNAVINLRETD